MKHATHAVTIVTSLMYSTAYKMAGADIKVKAMTDSFKQNTVFFAFIVDDTHCLANLRKKKLHAVTQMHRDPHRGSYWTEYCLLVKQCLFSGVQVAVYCPLIDHGPALERLL